MCLTFFGVKYSSKLLFVIDRNLIGFCFGVVTVFESTHARTPETGKDSKISGWIGPLGLQKKAQRV